MSQTHEFIPHDDDVHQTIELPSKATGWGEDSDSDDAKDWTMCLNKGSACANSMSFYSMVQFSSILKDYLSTRLPDKHYDFTIVKAPHNAMRAAGKESYVIVDDESDKEYTIYVKNYASHLINMNPLDESDCGRLVMRSVIKSISHVVQIHTLEWEDVIVKREFVKLIPVVHELKDLFTEGSRLEE